MMSNNNILDPSLPYTSRCEITEEERVFLLYNSKKRDLPSENTVPTLLNHNEPSPSSELTHRVKKWLTVIIISRYILIFLSATQTVSSIFVVYEWPGLRTLKLTVLFFGCVGVIFGLIITFAFRSVHADIFLAQPSLVLYHFSFFVQYVYSVFSSFLWLLSIYILYQFKFLVCTYAR